MYIEKVGRSQLLLGRRISGSFCLEGSSVPLGKCVLSVGLVGSLFLWVWETHLSFSTMEDITKGWNQLSLSDQEGSGFHLRKELASEEFILMAKFFTKRVLNTKSLARTFNQLWRSRNNLFLGDNIVLFILDNKIRVD